MRFGVLCTFGCIHNYSYIETVADVDVDVDAAVASKKGMPLKEVIRDGMMTVTLAE